MLVRNLSDYTSCNVCDPLPRMSSAFWERAQTCCDHVSVVICVYKQDLVSIYLVLVQMLEQYLNMGQVSSCQSASVDV